MQGVLFPGYFIDNSRPSVYTETIPTREVYYMKYFHVYDRRTFDGLVKNNFITEDTGFKLQHTYQMPGQRKFNREAAIGSPLHSLIKEGSRPFYVDRLTGGLRYHPYYFDKALIREYRALLGDWFLGFQQHELLGRRADWARVAQVYEKLGGPCSTVELQEQLFTPEYLTPDGTPIYHLTQGSPAEYTSRPMITDVKSCTEDVEWLLRRRLDQTDNALFLCCSGHVMFRVGDRMGLNCFVPELGAQTGHARISVALARGLARTKGRMWGVYYECWRRNKPIGNDFGYTKPVFNDTPELNDWHSRQDQFIDDFTTGGLNGGSSRLLQRRIYYFALMSGAQFLTDEWEMANNYRDLNTFELSEYGRLKKDFLQFARDHKQVKSHNPFAIVLPCDYEDIQLFGFSRAAVGHKPTLMSFPVSDADAARFGHVEDLLNYFYRRDMEREVGNESHTMQNSAFGDLFDIVYADAPPETLAQYDRLIDADPKGTFAAKYAGRLPVLTSEDFEAVGKQIRDRAAQVLPITVDSLHWLLSEDENGRYLTVFNNEGNDRTLAEGDHVDHAAADATTTIRTKPGVELSVLYASSPNTRLERLDDGNYSLFLPATDLVVLRQR